MTAAGKNRTKLAVVAGALVIGAVALVLLVWPRNVGAVAMSTTLVRGETVTRIDYTVSGNGIVPINGSATVSNAAQPISFVVDRLPPGEGYLIDQWAGDGQTRCNRRDSFEVVKGRTTSLIKLLLCRVSNSAGTRAALAFERKVAPRNTEGAVQPAAAVPPSCVSCEKANIEAGECEPDSGCDGLTGEDKQLCVNLLDCLRATNCWIKDPLDCLCGTARDLECTTNAANGDCRAEIQAATRTTDPIANGTLFFDPGVPASRANKLISCDKEKCLDHCAMK
jgi:hypothetical protein